MRAGCLRNRFCIKHGLNLTQGRPGPAPRRAAAVETSSPFSSSVRLLLVEDDRMLARGIAAALKQCGYAVDLAATVNEALRFVEANVYELCILDLSLPDGDGLDVLQRWRMAGARFPVLILSARGDL